MIRMGVSGWMFLLVPAHPGSSGQRAVKWLYVCVCVCISLLLYYLKLQIGMVDEVKVETICWAFVPFS